MYRIVKKEKLNDAVDLMTILAPNVSRKCEAGQFIILRVDETGERIPLTITDYDRDLQTVDIVYQKVGYSTKKLALKEVGDFILDFVGPLGVPTHLEQHKRVLGIGGGVGIAPLYPQIRKLKEMGVAVDVILGGRTDELIILKDKFEGMVDRVIYATNDGSTGIKGFVTDALDQLLNEGNVYDEIIAIGPVVMMKSVVNKTKPLNIKTSVSLNPIMIDGTGMCGACRVNIAGKVKFACVDGPDFDGFSVDFDELMARQVYYKKEEEHACNLLKMEVQHD